VELTLIRKRARLRLKRPLNKLLTGHIHEMPFTG
jgi:hypothetical protein